jgi:two-component system cell cycle sensor histidine kinase/response regulator CckA
MTDKKTELRKQAEERASHVPEDLEALSPAEIRQTLHELRVHQIELEIQNEELRRAQVELDAAGDRFFDFYDLAPVGYVTISEKGLILEANLTTATLLGVVRRSLVKRLISQFILKEDRNIYYLHRKQLFATHATDSTGSLQPRAAQAGTSQSFELRMLKNDGTTFWARLEAITAKDAGGVPTCRIVISNINERKLADEERTLSETRLVEAQAVAKIGSWETDLLNMKVIWSKETYRIFDIDPDNFQSSHIGFLAFVHPDDRAKVDAAFVGSIDNHFLNTIEHRIVTLGGIVKFVEESWQIFHDDKGLPTRAAGTCQDITERKRAEETLRESEERFNKAFRMSPIPTVISTLEDGRFLDVNEAFSRALLFSREEVIGRTSLELGLFANPDQRQAIRKKTEEKGYAKDIETQMVAKNGQIIDGLFSAEPVTINNKKCWLTVMVDVTEKKQAEQALREERQRLSGIIKGTNVGTWEWNVQTGETIFNDRWAELIGYTLDEISPVSIETWMKYAHPDDLKASGELLEKHFRGELDYYEFESRMKHKDGNWVWVLDRGKVTSWTEDGNPLMIMGTHQDITKRRRAEEALRESEKQYRTLFAAIADTVFLIDQETGSILDANPAATRIYGFSREEFLQMNAADVSAEPEKTAKALGETVPFIPLRYHRHKDGTVFHVELTASSFELRGRNTIIATSRDITARKQMEDELLRIQRLESLGILAGGIAHDFNNLMTIVQGYIELTLNDLPLGHVSRQRLLTAMRSVAQTQDLTSRLITFSRGGGPVKEIVDVAKALHEAVHKKIKETKVPVRFDFRENLWPVDVDESQMRQVFYNLTTNAVEAMPAGGNLTIQVENELLPAGKVPDLKEGSYLKITFTDEGPGIPADLLSKIFDPYFTTKKIGALQGLGLGLAVCWSILKYHDGHIMVKSLPGKGASFVLYLPAKPELAVEKEVKETLPTVTIRVLIMDDDPQICEIERAYLEIMGYEVTDVRDGQEAIDAYRRALDSGNPFDLVMLELTVRQGMGGKLAMERLLKIDPSIKAVIASGYVTDPVIEKYGDYGFRGKLKKPFKQEEIQSLVRKILHG